MGEFSLESAHEHEYGFQIYDNTLNRCISIPKSDGGANPADRGYDYAIWIHHNRLSDSYTIEGPRNFLVVSDNYIDLTHTGGRVYTHHGGISTEKIQIYRNVILNVDRSFVWVGRGTANNIKMFNNTIYCADAGDRTNAVLDFSNSGNVTIKGWEFRNNVVIAPDAKPRKLMWPNDNNANVIATNNLFVNVNSVPAENIVDEDPGFQLSGDKPFPYFATTASSLVIDEGVDVGLDFTGTAPDIGAYEFDPITSAVSPLDNHDRKLILFPNPTDGTIYLKGVKGAVQSGFNRFLWKRKVGQFSFRRNVGT